MKFDNYTIRLLTSNDLDEYFKLVENNRSRLEAFFTGTVSKTRTLEDTRAFLLQNDQKVIDRTYFPYVIADESGRFIGFLDLKNLDWSIPKSEIGCYVDEGCAGKGLAAKALELFCDFCFKEYGFRKLFLRTHHSNAAAIRIAEKCGFELEGTIRREYKTTSGEVVDLLYYGKLSSE